MRKAIQISTAPAVAGSDFHRAEDSKVVALCDDGTVWWTATHSKRWIEYPPIPQPEIAADEVVMPMLGEVIFICDAQTPTTETQVIFTKTADDYIFANDFITMRRLHGNWWRRNKQCPWRDASGKIVEVCA